MAITASEFSVASNGNVRSLSGSTVYSVLELHEWLQDLADNAAPSSDDQVSMLGPNPSELAGKRNAVRPMALTLLNGLNIDDATAQRFKFGSVEQESGDTLYTGLKTIGSVVAGSPVYVVQNGSKVSAWWGTGHIQILLKCKTAGALIDNGDVTVFSRKYGQTFSHFDVNLAAGGEAQAALSTAVDASVTLNATQAEAKFADITLTVGDTTQTLGGVTKLYKGTITLANGITLAEAYQALQWACSENSTATLNSVPGWRYRKLNGAYAENAAAPFGTFAGGKWFVAQGWWVAGALPADSKNYQLTSDDGTIVTPPTSIGITVGNLVVGDYVLAGKDSGAGGFAADYTATGAQGATSITVSPAPGGDVPTEGYVRINGNRHTYTGISGGTVSGLAPAVPTGGYSGAAAWFPYLDLTADATSESSNAFLYGGTPFNCRLRVRNGSGASAIVPFETTFQVADAGASVNAVRTADV